MSLSLEQLKELSFPFAIEDHYLRFGHGNKGYVTWLAYLTRPAITRRLADVLDGNVSDTIIREWNDGNNYNVIVEVAYGEENRIRHQAIGTDTDFMAAETRAYKRAVSHMQVGLYLYELPIIQTRNTGYYDPQTKRVDQYSEGYKKGISEARNALEKIIQKWLDPVAEVFDDEPAEKRSQIWESLKNDETIRARYSNKQYLKNALKKYHAETDGDVTTDGYLIVKGWLLSRETSNEKKEAEMYADS